MANIKQIKVGTTTYDIDAVTLDGHGSSYFAPAVSGGYLPLSGGTLTGNLNLKANQYDRQGALNCNNSDIMGVNSIYTQDTADNTAEGIRFYRDSTHYDSFTMSGGVMYFMPNDVASGTAFSSAKVVLHSGNIGSYAGNGTLTIQKNGTNVATFTANQSSNATANITVPTVTDYYWADVKVSASSSKGTTPTFSTVTVGGSGSTAGKATMQYNATEDCIDFIFA